MPTSLLLLVPAIAIESNALRVGSIGWAFEHGYTWSIKEPLAWGGIVFGGSDHRARTSHVEAESLAARAWPNRPTRSRRLFGLRSGTVGFHARWGGGLRTGTVDFRVR